VCAGAPAHPLAAPWAVAARARVSMAYGECVKSVNYVFLSVYLSVCLPACLSVCLSGCPSVSASVSVSVSVSVLVYVCLCVRAALWAVATHARVSMAHGAWYAWCVCIRVCFVYPFLSGVYVCQAAVLQCVLCMYVIFPHLLCVFIRVCSVYITLHVLCIYVMCLDFLCIHSCLL